MAWNNGSDEPASISDLGIIFSNFLNVVLGLAGAILFVMLLVGGINYLFSGGDPEKVKKAGATLTWAITGFVFLFLSWFILIFLKEFTGYDLTNVQLPGI